MTVDFCLPSFSNALAQAPDAASAFAILEERSRHLFDHILFTCLRFDYDGQVMTRLYSNREDVCPSGGSKPFPSGIWADRIITSGVHYVGTSRVDLQSVFSDYEALWAIGCESVMNIPARWRGRTVGSLNILGRANQFDQEAVGQFSMLAQLAVPLFLQNERALWAIEEAQSSTAKKLGHSLDCRAPSKWGAQ